MQLEKSEAGSDIISKSKFQPWREIKHNLSSHQPWLERISKQQICGFVTTNLWNSQNSACIFLWSFCCYWYDLFIWESLGRIIYKMNGFESVLMYQCRVRREDVLCALYELYRRMDYTFKWRWECLFRCICRWTNYPIPEEGGNMWMFVVT